MSKSLKIISLAFYFASFFIFVNYGDAAFIIKAPVNLGLTTGLVGHWTFDGANVSGTSATDKSGQGYNGTFSGGGGGSEQKVTFCASGCDNSVGTTTWQVPVGVTTLTVKAWGAGGGGGGAQSGGSNGGAGGGGGFAQSDIAVTPGENLEIVVAGGGAGGVGTAGDGGAGGGGGATTGGGGKSGSAAGTAGGGGGGGYVTVVRSGTTFLIIGAGGGGGGGSADSDEGVGGKGGAGGGTNGVAGSASTVQINAGGVAGTSIAGGSGGGGGDGSGKNGGTGLDTAYDGGGGGSGLFGGEGGAAGSLAGGGGGGGSGSGDTLTAGSLQTAGNNLDEDYANSAGAGGAGGTSASNPGVNGTAGRIVLIYTPAGGGTSAPNLVSGKIGQAVRFDGTAKYLDIGTGPSSVKGVSFWVYPESSTQYFVNLTGTSDYIWLNAGTVTATGFTSPKIYVDGAETTAMSAGTWHHVAVVTDTAENSSNFDIGRTADANYLTGRIDDVRVYNKALSKSEVTRLYKIGGTLKIGKTPSNDSLQKGLVGHWTFDGLDTFGLNTADKSGQGNTGTLTGGPTPVKGKIGQGMNFDGVDDYVEVADNSSLDFGTGSFTFSVWTKRDVVSPAIRDEMIDHVAGGGTHAIWSFIDTDNTVNLQLRNPAGQRYYTQTSSAVITDTNWHYIVMMRDSTAQSLKYFIDGIEKSTIIVANDAGPLLDLDIDGVVRIGANPPSASVFFNGTIDDVRVYNRALSAGEIQRLYRIGGTLKIGTTISNDSLKNGLVGHWTFDGPDTFGLNTADKSGNGNTGTLTEGPTKVKGKIGQGLDFDGTDDYISVPANSSLDVSATQSLTISAWAKTGNTANSPIILERFGAGNVPYYRLAVGAACSASKAELSIRDVGPTAELWTCSTTSINDNTWHHIVGIRDTVADVLKIYIDGVLEDTDADTSSANLAMDNNLLIGQHIGNQYWDGYIDDVRIYNRALSAAEVQRLYNSGR